MNRFKYIISIIIFLVLVLCPIKADALATLKELSVDNATLSPEFSKDNFSYDVIMKSEILDTKINYKLDDNKAIITNTGDVTLENNKEHIMVVIDEDGNLTIYNLHPIKVAKTLKTLEFENITFTFKENVLDYTFSVPYSITELKVKKIDNNYTYSFNETKLRIGKNDITMTVKTSNEPDLNYTFHINRNEMTTISSQDINYKGSGYETYTVPKTGMYKIELWGAQGGVYGSNLYGGKGAYTSGEIVLNESERLHFYIGGSSSTRLGGYNGGANGGTVTGDGTARGGGGATDVRLVEGAWNNFNSLKSRIMVAAGGGGAVFYQSAYPAGGAAGGLTGYSASHQGVSHTLAGGGTQTTGGTPGGVSSTCSIGARGSFGSGGAGGTTAPPQNGNYYGGGGGGGYFGGGGGGCIPSGVSSGAGGSSYISGHNGSRAVTSTSSSTSISFTSNSIHYSNKVFTNTKMVDGLGKSWTTSAGSSTNNMPTWNGSSTMVGNAGNGHAKITFLGAVPKLSDLIINGGELEETFNPDTFTYNLELTDEDTEIEVTGLTDDYDLKVEGNGKYTIKPNTSEIKIKVSNLSGASNTYTIKVNRTISSAPILKGILVNGYEIPDFDPETLEYTIEVEDYFPVVVINGLKAYPNQTITGEGVKILDNVDNLDATLLVSSEDKQLDYKYTIHIIKKVTTKLKSLVLNNDSSLIDFQPYKTDYEVKLLSNILNLDVNAIAASTGATVEIKGNSYLSPVKDSNITITVSKENLEPTVYTIKVIRDNDISAYQYNYPYDSSKAYYEFVAPTNGFYNIEAWGAQGGSYNGNYGGKGSYTSGEIKLLQGEKLYIYVGSSSETTTGGTNGGAAGGVVVGDGSSRGGGGATDIRLVSGAWNNFDSLKSRIMVAAGGGGAIIYKNVYVNGGAGGGLNGYGASYNGIGHTLAGGGTQTAGGTRGGVSNCSLGAVGTFGSGGAGGTTAPANGNYYGAGGGSGYFGGGGGGCISCGVSSGAGGSSYISGHEGSNSIMSSSTSSRILFSNSSTHYSNKTFNNTVMIDGNGYLWSNKRGSLSLMPKHDTGYFNSGSGNTGDGYAKIKLVSLLSSDNYLDDLVVSTGELTPSFDPGVLEYNLNLGETDYSLEIGATPKDPNAFIMGTGLFDVKAGNTDYEINVTATDGSIRTYVIHVFRQGSRDAAPTNIKLNRLSTYLCKKDPTYCKYKFDKDVFNYDIIIPFVTSEIELKATPNNIYQKIEYFKYVNDEYVKTETGLYSLDTGTNKFKVVVAAEDEVTKNEYFYSITRDNAGNANLKTLRIENPDIIFDFNKNVYEYYLNIDSSYTRYDVIAETEADTAKVTSIVGNEDLKVGMNDCYITVTSLNNTTKTYVIHMYKERDTNVFLDSLEVQDSKGNNLDINPTFNKLLNNYTLDVSNDIKEIDIKAIPASLDAVVTGTGKQTLKAGVNNFTIKVESGDNVNEYELVVNRKKNDNPLLKNITIDGISLMPDFESEVFEYYVVITDDVKVLDLNVEPIEDTTTYTIKGNNIVNDLQDVVITSVAEDKSYEVYTIHVSHDMDTDNTLKNIELSDGFNLNEEFSPTKKEYTIDVLEDTDKIEIKGIPNSIKARVDGNGIYSLLDGDNKVLIDVTNQLGKVNTYTIIINKPKNDDVTLKNITNNQNAIVSKDEREEKTYLINVQYEVSSIRIDGIPNASTSVVSGNGTYNLTPGENLITLRVTSEAGNYQDYKIKVIRDKNNNDDLNFLFVEEGGLTPRFNETIILYDVKVPNEINTLHIEAITEDKNATYEVRGGTKLDNGKYTYDISSFEVDTPQFIEVIVTAENGIDQKTYTLSVTRQQSTTENLALLDLIVKQNENNLDLTPVFNPDTLNYEITVENNVSEVDVSATALGDNVEVRGEGKYNLIVGKNAIAVFVIGESGVQRDYQIVVTRKKSSDAKLANLVVKGHVLSPSFNSDTASYTITTSASSLEFTTIKPVEEEATYEIGIVKDNNFEVLTTNNMLDISSLESGSKIVIRVTAPDGLITKDYNITINKELSKNNNLASLEVVGYNLTPIFHKGVNLYTVDLPNNVNNVVINAKAEDEKATVTGTGSKKISVGSNIFEVIVESEAKTTKKYTIIISKDGSTNNNLASLNVSEGTLSPEFSPNEQLYNVTVSGDVTRIKITGTLEDANATTNDFGDYDLIVGKNEIEIMVTSESGDIKVYKVIVTRDDFIDATLKDLKVKDYELDTPFAPELTEYYINVNHEIDSLDKLDISAIPNDDNATVSITSENETFLYGINEIKILVTAKDLTTTKEYSLFVNRNLSTNNYLQSIDISEGTLSPEFNPEVLEYEVHVANDIDNIDIYATTEDSSSTIVSGTGNFKLLVGSNKIQIKVKSSIGIYRTYLLNIIREGSKDNYLLSLNVKNNGEVLNFDQPFVKEENNYTLTVPSDVLFVTIEAIPNSDLATVIGDGTKNLDKGTNTFEVSVTSEEGEVNVYTIAITKEASNNKNITDIIPHSGTFTEEFNPNIKEYTLNISSDIVSVGFDVIKEDETAIVSGNEDQLLTNENMNRTITITAEDGSQDFYTIHIIKENEVSALLESLTIENYPFEFNSDTFIYNIQVSKQKKKLLESEITAIAKDSEATVNMMGDLNLTDGIVNIYTIEVIAKDGYTTQTYTLNITRDSEEYTIRTNKYEIVRFEDETNEDYVIGIQPSTVISDFKNNFENPAEDLKVYLDTTEVQETDLTATAFVLKLEKNNHVYDTLRVIVRGDLTKDGKVNITDQVKMINYVGRTTTFDKYQMLAGDLTFDGKVNITDQVKIINYVGRTISDLNNKPTN